ncbi:MAG: replication initiator protein A [Acidobacteria bacterium]|nr:replication initiator protein A [Acidobacteriota bacterium]
MNGDRRRTGLEHAGSILQDRFAEFHVSRRRLRQAESIQLVRDRRNAANQQLGFASRPFVLCGLPVRCPPRSTLVYERRNGLFTLQITGHPDFGLPFGQDRLVPIFLATLAVRQQSQTIRFRSAAEMLDTFGMAKGGKEYRRLVAAFERIFGATIFFGTESTRKQVRVIQRSRFNFLSEAQIWYSRDPTQVFSAGSENVIVLSDEFYKEVIAHPIPADIEAVKAFGSAPAVLDLFMWLTYRCFTAKSEERIPLFGDFGLTAQLGSVEYSRPRRFRAMLEQWMAQVRTVWPECPAQICADGHYLRLSPAKAVLPTA